MNVRKLSTMLWGVLKNFLNKEDKNKVNYTRYIFLKERGEKNSDQFSQLRMRKLRMKLLCKWIGLDLVHWFHWDLDIYQIIATCSHFNEISIISPIIGHHEITLSVLVIYLFIILKKEGKKIKEMLKLNDRVKQTTKERRKRHQLIQHS